MRRPRVASAAAACATAILSMLVPPGGATAAPDAGFVTSAEPFLVALEPDVTITPILTTGDVIGEGPAAYQMSGVPDGTGWYESAPDVFEVYFNHELHPDYDPSGSRVSHITLDATGAVTAARYVIDGTERYEWFCSATLETIDGVPWFTAGEESKHSPRQGMSFAIRATTDRVHETPWFGHFGHENVVPVEGLSKAYVGLSEDGFSEYSQLFAYLAPDFDGALRGTAGSLRVWVPTPGARELTDGDPSSNDILKGGTIRGRFERIPNARNLTPLKLEKTVQEMGAWDFDRIEDQIDDPDEPGTIYFAETGRAHAYAPRGRVYRLQVNPDDPTRARLSVVLDSKEGDDIFSPDNLGISHTSLVIQEDRNWKRSGYNRVLVYDLDAATLTPVARTDPDQSIVDEKGPGAWESSGVVSAADAFGAGYWLLMVQAHYTEMDVPDQTLVPDSATGEGGQLELVYIPGT